MKHAFTGEAAGTIKIQLKTSVLNGTLNLNYSDSGEWREPKQEDSFGLELIEILTEQMEGTQTREGSSYYFEIPLDI